MEWSLPTTVEINGKKIKIRNKCDYRVVLDTIEILYDRELSQEQALICALYVFYDIPKKTKSVEADVFNVVKDINTATMEMLKIINLGEAPSNEERPRLVDWKRDFSLMAPPISRTLGYSVRDEKNFTHWYDFVGAYMEIGGECTFSHIISIRHKRMKGKKLEKWEEEFYRENRKMIDLPYNISPEDEDFLNFDI